MYGYIQWNKIHKRKFDIKQAKTQLKRWLKEDFGAFNVEPHYSKIEKPRIICEEYFGESITDYKFFCFNGRPLFLHVSYDLFNDRKAKVGYFDAEFNKLPIVRDDYADIGSIAKPSYFDEMLKVAQDIAQDFPFVRVDFFAFDDFYTFSELTFTPGAAMMPLKPYSFDIEWGKHFVLPQSTDNFSSGNFV